MPLVPDAREIHEFVLNTSHAQSGAAATVTVPVAAPKSCVRLVGKIESTQEGPAAWLMVNH